MTDPAADLALLPPPAPIESAGTLVEALTACIDAYEPIPVDWPAWSTTLPVASVE